jgi:hypothetical protein
MYYQQPSPFSVWTNAVLENRGTLKLDASAIPLFTTLTNFGNILANGTLITLNTLQNTATGTISVLSGIFPRNFF